MGRRSNWTREMDAVLLRVYPTRGGGACARELGLSSDQVWARASKLGVVSSYGRGRLGWTQAEDDLLREHYPAGGAHACRAVLPGRNPGSIKGRASYLYLHIRGHNGSPASLCGCDDRALREAMARLDELIRARIAAGEPSSLVTRHPSLETEALR